MTARQYRIFHKLSVTAHRLQKLADQRVSEVAPITTAQAAVLSALKNGEASTQKDIAALLGLNESAITAMMGRLRRSGYIDRERNKEDGRAWRISLTTDGEAALAQTIEPFSTINKILDDTLDDDEIALFADMLTRIAAATPINT